MRDADQKHSENTCSKLKQVSFSGDFWQKSCLKQRKCLWFFSLLDQVLIIIITLNRIWIVISPNPMSWPFTFYVCVTDSKQGNSFNGNLQPVKKQSVCMRQSNATCKEQRWQNLWIPPQKKKSATTNVCPWWTRRPFSRRPTAHLPRDVNRQTDRMIDRQTRLKNYLPAPHCGQ